MTAAMLRELAKLFQVEADEAAQSFRTVDLEEAHRLRAESWAIEHAAVRAAYERRTS